MKEVSFEHKHEKREKTNSKKKGRESNFVRRKSTSNIVDRKTVTPVLKRANSFVLKSCLRNPDLAKSTNSNKTVTIVEVVNGDKWSYIKRITKTEEQIQQIKIKREKNTLPPLSDNLELTLTLTDWDTGILTKKGKKAYWKLIFDGHEVSSSPLDSFYWKPQITFKLGKLKDSDGNYQNLSFQLCRKNILSSTSYIVTGSISMLDLCLPNSSPLKIITLTDKKGGLHSLKFSAEVSSPSAVLRWICNNDPSRAILFLENMDSPLVQKKLHHYGRILSELHTKIDLRPFFKQSLEKYKADKLEGRLAVASLIKTGLIETFFPLDQHNKELVEESLKLFQLATGPEVEAIWEKHQLYLKCLFVIATEVYSLTQPIINLVRAWLKYDTIRGAVISYILKSHLCNLFMTTKKFNFMEYAKGHKYLQRKYIGVLDDRPKRIPEDITDVVTQEVNGKNEENNISRENESKQTISTIDNEEINRSEKKSEKNSDKSKLNNTEGNSSQTCVRKLRKYPSSRCTPTIKEFREPTIKTHNTDHRKRVDKHVGGLSTPRKKGRPSSDQKLQDFPFSKNNNNVVELPKQGKGKDEHHSEPNFVKSRTQKHENHEKIKEGHSETSVKILHRKPSKKLIENDSEIEKSNTRGSDENNHQLGKRGKKTSTRSQREKKITEGPQKSVLNKSNKNSGEMINSDKKTIVISV